MRSEPAQPLFCLSPPPVLFTSQTPTANFKNLASRNSTLSRPSLGTDAFYGHDFSVAKHDLEEPREWFAEGLKTAKLALDNDTGASLPGTQKVQA